METVMVTCVRNTILSITWNLKLGNLWTTAFWVSWDIPHPMQETPLADLVPRKSNATFGNDISACLRVLHCFSVIDFWMKPLGLAWVCLWLPRSILGNFSRPCIDLWRQNMKWHVSAIFALRVFSIWLIFSCIDLLWKCLSMLVVSVFQHVYMQ